MPGGESGVLWARVGRCKMKTKTNVSDGVLRVARGRGLSHKEIGLALGVSRQAIHQRIGGDHKWIKSRQDRRTPNFIRFANAWCLVRKPGTLVTVRCDFCGGPVQMKPSVMKIHEQHFCGVRCHGMSDRQIGNAGSLVAINLRLNGETWKGVAIEIGFSVQSIQRNLWRLLNERGFLTNDIVYAIWRPAPSIARKTFGVAHLIRGTGFSPRSAKKYTAFSQWARTE